MSVVGIVGAGKVGTTLARLGIRADWDALLSGSPRQVALELVVDVVAPGARVADLATLAGEADLIVLAVPFGKSDQIAWDLFDGKVVVDAMNHWAPVDGTRYDIDDGLSTSEVVAARNPKMRLVKSLNHIGYHDMEDDARPPGDPLRRAVAVAGDDHDAKARTGSFIDAIGFDVVDAGPLAAGHAFQPGHFIFGRELSRSELTKALAIQETPTFAA